MNSDILDDDKEPRKEIVPESPGITISRNDLMLAELIKATKTGFNNLVGDNLTTSGEPNKFFNPDIIKKAIEIQQKYQFQPLGNNADFSYLSSVISIDDFKKHPDRYFHKLAKGFGSFPLDFDFSILSNNIFDIEGLKFSNGIMSFQHQSIFATSAETAPEGLTGAERDDFLWAIYAKREGGLNNLSYAINKAFIDSGCCSFHTEGYMYIDILTFLKNYDNLVVCVNNEIDDLGYRDHALKSLSVLKIGTLAMLNTVTNCIISSPNDFFSSPKVSFEQVQQTGLQKDFSINQHNPFKAHNVEEEGVFLNIENLLLHTTRGTGKGDIDKLIKLQNPDQFNHLVGLLIEQLQKDPKIRNTWVDNNKDISQYDAKELVVLATYLSRYMIDKYENLDTMAENVLRGFSPTSLSGKCTDYTGMTLHIINNYLKPLYPEPFKNIIVGYDTQNIGDKYKHCYMKIYGYNEAGQIEVTFIDPTKLANAPLSSLKITDDILKIVDSSNLPIQIKRNAEDILIAKLREEANGNKSFLESESAIKSLTNTRSPEGIIHMTLSFLEKLKNIFKK